MLVDNIIALARLQTHTDSNQISDANALIYLNIVYQDFASRIIREVDEDYFWDIFTTSSVLDQNEYTFATATATAAGMKKIQRIQIKWAATDDFTSLIDSDTLANYPTTTDRLDSQLSKDKGFYDIKDGSYFIYPAPGEAVTNGIEVQATSTLIDLIAWGSENTVYPRNSELRDYHHILATGMKQYIYWEQGLTNDKNDSINEYIQKVDEIVNQIKDRHYNPVETQLPNAINLKI